MIKPLQWLTLGALTLTLVGCAQNTDTQNSQTTPGSKNRGSDTEAVVDTQPVLFNLGGVNLAEDVEFNPHSLDIASGKNVAVFLFGQPLPANPGESIRINPNIEFGGLKTPIDIVASIDGVVGFIKEQPETNDYEVYLMSSEQSTWILGYDHVTDLQVEKGQLVSVGDVLGKAAKENTGYYRYELQINHETNGDSNMYCPTDLLDESVRNDEKAKVDAFVENWNALYNAEFGSDAYATQSGGCIKPMVTNAESQGQI